MALAFEGDITVLNFSLLYNRIVLIKRYDANHKFIRHKFEQYYNTASSIY